MTNTFSQSSKRFATHTHTHTHTESSKVGQKKAEKRIRPHPVFRWIRFLPTMYVTDCGDQQVNTSPFSDTVRSFGRRTRLTRSCLRGAGKSRRVRVPCCCCTSTRDTLNYGLLFWDWEAQDDHLDFHTAPELWSWEDDDDVELNVLGCRIDILGRNCDQRVSMVQCCFTSTETVRLVRTRSPGRPGHLLSSEVLRIKAQGPQCVVSL